jgi:nucleotide-binding universal stress UspA family protein
MFQRILVPLDGSLRAEQALPVAARLARASGGTVLLAQVVGPPLDYGGGLAQAPLMTEQVIETEFAQANSYLKTVAQSPLLAGVETRAEVMFGFPVQHILDVRESRAADLIVMCSHGRTGFTRWVLGSVAHQLIHQNPVPVLILHEGTPAPHADAAHPFSVLVPLDGSPLAETALVPAVNLVAALAAPGQGALHLMQVVKRLSTTAEEGFVSQLNTETVERGKEYLARVKESLQEKDPWLSIIWSVVLDSDVAGAIIRTAEQGQQGEGGERSGGCDLVAMSTHGRGGLERLVMGSVTERVLGATKLPLLVVRPERVG